MREIFELLPTTKGPCSEEKMTACINDEETTVFLGIGASDEQSSILLSFSDKHRCGSDH